MAALTAPAALPELRTLDERGELARLVPELDAGRAFKQPELHYYDVLQHNLAAVGAFDAAAGETAEGAELRAEVSWLDFEAAFAGDIDGVPVLALTRLATLLHDVAKPDTAVFADGRLRFPRHGPRGAELMRERLPQLGFGPTATDFVARLIRNHLRPGELVKNWPVTDRAVRKFVADVDGHVLPLMLLNLADGWATRGPGYTRENFRRHCTFVNYVVAHAVSVTTEGPPPLVTGEDLMRDLDLESGRLLGAVLTSVRRAQEAGAVSDRDEAMALARETPASLLQSEND